MIDACRCQDPHEFLNVIDGALSGMMGSLINNSDYPEGEAGDLKALRIDETKVPHP
jgi:hypothetical protein